METAWIQVFVLVLSECVAPAGKTVCQEQELELQFFSEADCQAALEEMLALKEESEHTIVNRHASRCVSTARQTDAFASLEAINEAYKDKAGWQAPGESDTRTVQTHAVHQDRLASLKTCEETVGRAPCKIGEIIIEGASGDAVEVWRRDE